MDITKLNRIKTIKKLEETAKYKIGEIVQITNPDKDQKKELTK